MALDFDQMIDRLFHRLRQRVGGMVGRGILRTTNDIMAAQEAQVERRIGEVVSGVEVLHPYGFRSNPPVGAEVITLAVGGDPNHVVALPPFDRRHGGPPLQAGDTALFSSDGGTSVHLKGDGTVMIKGGLKIRLEVGSSSIEILSGSIRLTTPSFDAGQS